MKNLFSILLITVLISCENSNDSNELITTDEFSGIVETSLATANETTYGYTDPIPGDGSVKVGFITDDLKGFEQYKLLICDNVSEARYLTAENAGLLTNVSICRYDSQGRMVIDITVLPCTGSNDYNCADIDDPNDYNYDYISEFEMVLDNSSTSYYINLTVD